MRRYDVAMAETYRLRLPLETKQAALRAAQARGVTLAELVRASLAEAIRAA